MKVCDVCNVIVSAGQGCSLSNCPNQSSGPAASAPAEVNHLPLGRSDQVAQAGLDGIGDVAGHATRRAAFIVGVVFLVVLGVAAIGFNYWGKTVGTSS
jgi:hypothetical protein